MKHHRGKHQPYYERPIRWLPIDSRFITPIFKFSSVKGTARLFLELEITLTLLIVTSTVLWAGFRIFMLLIK